MSESTSKQAFQAPVQDSVPKINDEVAVGEDLEFQRRWWKFERAVWTLFTLLIVLTAAGLFGRGPLAHAKTSNDCMDVEYERVERSGTPSMLRVSFKPAAIHDGKVLLYVSESVVKQLGAQRIIPAPESSRVGDGGITYTFAAAGTPATVGFALQPDGPGITHFTLKVPGADPILERIVTVP